jgi:hypothetical protein
MAQLVNDLPYALHPVVVRLRDLDGFGFRHWSIT